MNQVNLRFADSADSALDLCMFSSTFVLLFFIQTSADYTCLCSFVNDKFCEFKHLDWNVPIALPIAAWPTAAAPEPLQGETPVATGNITIKLNKCLSACRCVMMTRGRHVDPSGGEPRSLDGTNCCVFLQQRLVTGRHTLARMLYCTVNLQNNRERHYVYFVGLNRGQLDFYFT